MIVPESLIWLCNPAARTVPVRVPVAPSKMPVPPTITSVSVPDAGSALFGWQAPGQSPLLNVSSMKIDPPARLIVRKSQPSPQAPNSIVSVAWPNGIHLALTAEAFRNHSASPLLNAGTTGSVNVSLTGIVVEAAAGDATASRTPNPSRNASRRIRRPFQRGCWSWTGECPPSGRAGQAGRSAAVALPRALDPTNRDGGSTDPRQPHTAACLERRPMDGHA